MIPASFFSLLVALQAQPTPLSLDDALRIGLENSFKIRLSKITEAKSRDLVKAAMASVGFQLNTQFGYTKYFNPIPIFGGQTQKESQTASATLSFGVDINKINAMAIRATRWGLTADQAQVIAEINNEKQSIRAGYYNVVKATWVEQIREAAVTSTQERERVGKAKKQEGVLANFDLLRIETDLQSAIANLRTAKTNLDQAKATLNNTLGRNPETPFDVTDVSTFAPSKEDLADLTNHALSYRPELKASQARVEQAKLNTKIEQRSMLPSLNVGITHQRTFDPTPFQTSSNTIGQVTLSIPLYDGGATRARVAADRRDEQTAETQTEQLKQAIRLQVEIALLNLQSAKDQMVIAEQNLKYAAEARRLADVRFANGLGIVLDTIQAQESLTTAESALAQAKYQYLSSFADLQLALGDDDYAFGASAGDGKK